MIKTIKSKIFLILMAFMILTIGNSLVSIVYFDKLQNSIDSIMYANYDSVVAAQNMKDALERQDSLEIAFIFEDNSTFSLMHARNHDIFTEWLEKAENNITEAGEDKIISAISKGYLDYSEKVKMLEILKESKGIESARNFYYAEVFPRFEVLKSQLSSLLELNQDSMVSMKEESKDLAMRASYYSITILVLVLIVGLSTIGYLLKKIIHPIENLEIGIKKVSKGDLSYKIPLQREEGTNFILREFNKMVSELKDYETLNVNEIFREKQKAEAIIESINTPVIVTNSKNFITMLNKSGERVLDVKEKNVINNHFLEVIDNKELFTIMKKSRELIKEVKYSEDIEMEINNKTFYYRVIANQIWFNKKENIGTVMIIHDITKFKEVEMLKTDFINTISHEFRTPLTSISMAINMLIEGEVSEEKLELLSIAREEEVHLERLVSELLDISKLESGKIQMEFEKVDIRMVLKGIQNTFKLQLEEKNIRLNIKILSDELYVKADFNKISWVMVNLIGNSIRYTGIDGIIEVEIKSIDKRMLIAVKDNGKGIPEEYIDKIFEKFVQLKVECEENSGSAGLGLAICKEILKAHNGEIWAESKEKQGATFFFTLNLEK